MSKAWIIPKDEVEDYFQIGERQDIKIIVPERLTEALWEILARQGKSLKPELPCKDIVWRCPGPGEPIQNWRSDEFKLEPAADSASPANALPTGASPASALPTGVTPASALPTSVMPASAPPTGLLALAFGNEKTPQEEHCHRRHFELYFSEHHLMAKWRGPDEPRFNQVDLPSGGAVIFAPGTFHKMRFGGLTLIIEFPAVTNDKFIA